VESSHLSLLLAITNYSFIFAAASSNGFSALSVSQYLLFTQYLNVRTQWAIIVYYAFLTSALYST
jgi:nucleoside recognition membrane protein YjiH